MKEIQGEKFRSSAFQRNTTWAVGILFTLGGIAAIAVVLATGVGGILWAVFPVLFLFPLIGIAALVYNFWTLRIVLIAGTGGFFVRQKSKWTEIPFEKISALHIDIYGNTNRGKLTVTLADGTAVSVAVTGVDGLKKLFPKDKEYTEEILTPDYSSGGFPS